MTGWAANSGLNIQPCLTTDSLQQAKRSSENQFSDDLLLLSVTNRALGVVSQQKQIRSKWSVLFSKSLADDIGWAQPDKIEFGKYGAAA